MNRPMQTLKVAQPWRMLVIKGVEVIVTGDELVRVQKVAGDLATVFDAAGIPFTLLTPSASFELLQAEKLRLEGQGGETFQKAPKERNHPFPFDSRSI